MARSLSFGPVAGHGTRESHALFGGRQGLGPLVTGLSIAITLAIGWCAPACADSPDLTEFLNSTQLACAGSMIGVFADIDNNGTNETFVVFNTVYGEAFPEVSSSWGYGTHLYFFSGVHGRCTFSNNVGRSVVWFVDATATGFVANNPASWTYKSVPGAQLVVFSDVCTWNGSSTAYRQVSAYTERMQGGSQVGSYSVNLNQNPGALQTCDFSSAQGIKELVLRSDFCENSVLQLIVRSGPSCQTPSITQQPVGLSRCPGGSATFSVSASPASGLTYQWRHDNVAIANASSSSLTLNQLAPADAGSYDVVITSSLGCGQVTSNAARLDLGCQNVLYRVNCGGPAVASGDGSMGWSGDTPESPSTYVNAAATGNATSVTAATLTLTHPSIPPATPAALFQDGRYDPPSSPEMIWSFPVPHPGRYVVRLYLLELYSAITAPGQRVFGVSINGTIAFRSIDIFAEVGLNAGLVKSYVANVTGSTLDITMLHGVENPAIQAIEVAEYTSNVVYRVNCGGPSLASLDGGGDWTEDSQGAPSPYANSGETNVTGAYAGSIDMANATIPAGTPMAMFQDERWDQPGGAEMRYEFPVEPGLYAVRLYFSEIYDAITGPGQRLFDLSITGMPTIHNFDVWLEAKGLYRGIVKTFTTAISGNMLGILFGHVVENPAIAGIEIVRYGGYADASSIPKQTDALAQNAPNPFRGRTSISFTLGRASRATVQVFDLAGRRVATLLDGASPPGLHTLTWDGRDEGGRPVRSGVYLCRLRADGIDQTRNMLVLE